MSLIEISARLSQHCAQLEFGPPVEVVYDPLDYAREPHEMYLRRFDGKHPQVVLVGMNPGPNGMLQTGVPFGDVRIVRDWMGIEGEVGQPPRLHPKRKIEGFACRRREVSGSRVWGWAQERFGSAESFFERFFVLNYCPLAFFEAGGQNRTPDKLKAAERQALFEVCDQALVDVLKTLQPRVVMGIGRLAEERAAVAATGLPVRIAGVTHPSPANPRANTGWAPLMDQAVEEAGIPLP